MVFLLLVMFSLLEPKVYYVSLLLYGADALQQFRSMECCNGGLCRNCAFPSGISE